MTCIIAKNATSIFPSP